MSDSAYSETLKRFTGFGGQYDGVRPAAPAALADLLLWFWSARVRIGIV
ncbi:MAG: hypothetical protein V4726_20500 [Verrucomicrobiota bacterium]